MARKTHQLKVNRSFVFTLTIFVSASLGILMAPIASVVVGPTIDLIGRKKGLLFFYLDMGVGFTIIACATEVWHIYVGRCVCSFAIGE